MALPENAEAIGYYNVPGSFCQCFGYGCGAGYHAPLCLGPVSCRGFCRHGVNRLPYRPYSPYAGCDCGGGCAECGCNLDQPSVLEPAYVPAPATGPMVEPATEPVPEPAAFRVPFRY